MKRSAFNVLKYLAMLGVGIALLWLVFKDQNLSEVFYKIRHAKFGWIFLSLVFAFLAFASRGYRWIMLLEPLGYKAKMYNTYHAMMVGYFANLAIPRIGEVTRSGLLAQREKIPFEVVFGTVIVERIIDLILLIVAISCILIFQMDTLGGFFTENIFKPLQGKLSGVFGNPMIPIGVIAVIILIVFILRRSSKKNENSIGAKIKKLFKGIGEGIATVAQMKRPFAFIFHTFFIWFMYFMMTYVCFFAIESTAHLGPGEGLFTLIIGGLGMAAPVQGGIGTYHLLVSKGLQLFDISYNDGIVFATLVHTYQTLLVVFLGTVSLLMLFLSKRKNAIHESPATS
ncbi:MAG: flippase-like domain-containing protein [Bacteroidia bacterium]|nr:flippase-like domain-containing protein [Bacteroidia bacterium]